MQHRSQQELEVRRALRALTPEQFERIAAQFRVVCREERAKHEREFLALRLELTQLQLEATRDCLALARETNVFLQGLLTEVQSLR